MKDSQKTVFTMLIAILLLEFGSLTKAQKIWNLAFGGAVTTTPGSGVLPNVHGNSIQVQPSTHPTLQPPGVL